MEGNTVDYAKMYAQQANDLAQKAYDSQQKAIQLGVDKVVDDINYQKEVAKEDELKEAKSAYSDYAKQINPYGVEKEAIVGMGLAGSGYQESSKVNMNNTYQNRVSKAVDTTRRLFADYNNQINQAKMQGNIEMAQALADQYKFQIENLWKGFDLQYRQDRDAVNDKRYEQEWQYQQDRDDVNDSRYNQEWQYQQSRDAVNDSRYNQEWEYKKQRDEIEDSRYLSEWERQLALDRLDQEWKQKQFDYQVSRDEVSDSQWQQQYALQKKNSSGSSSRSSSSSSKSAVLDLNSNNDYGNISESSNNSNGNDDFSTISGTNAIINMINEVNAINSIPEDQFRDRLANAYENGRIDRNEVDRILRLRGV